MRNCKSRKFREYFRYRILTGGFVLKAEKNRKRAEVRVISFCFTVLMTENYYTAMLINTNVFIFKTFVVICHILGVCFLGISQFSQ